MRSVRPLCGPGPTLGRAKYAACPAAPYPTLLRRTHCTQLQQRGKTLAASPLLTGGARAGGAVPRPPTRRTPSVAAAAAYGPDADGDAADVDELGGEYDADDVMGQEFTGDQDLGDFEYPEEGLEGAFGEDDDEDDDDDKYPVPDKLGYYIGDLFARAVYLEHAMMLEERFPDLLIYGLQADPDMVVKDDIFFLECPEFLDYIAPAVTAALENGAAVLVLPQQAQMPLPDMPEIPSTVPVIYTDNVEEMAQRLASAYYETPSKDMLIVALVGSKGKTTTAWLVRGLLRQMEQTTGMIGTIEYAIDDRLLTVDGDLFFPTEDDPTAKSLSSAPYCISPYQGKYTVEKTTPSGLHVQKLLAGMRDRGARCAIVECTNEALEAGYLDWLEVNVIVHTNLLEGLEMKPGERHLADEVAWEKMVSQEPAAQLPKEMGREQADSLKREVYPWTAKFKEVEGEEKLLKMKLEWPLMHGLADHLELEQVEREKLTSGDGKNRVGRAEQEQLERGQLTDEQVGEGEEEQEGQQEDEEYVEAEEEEEDGEFDEAEEFEGEIVDDNGERGLQRSTGQSSSVSWAKAEKHAPTVDMSSTLFATAPYIRLTGREDCESAYLYGQALEEMQKDSRLLVRKTIAANKATRDAENAADAGQPSEALSAAAAAMEAELPLLEERYEASKAELSRVAIEQFGDGGVGSPETADDNNDEDEDDDDDDEEEEEEEDEEEEQVASGSSGESTAKNSDADLAFDPVAFEEFVAEVKEEEKAAWSAAEFYTSHGRRLRQRAALKSQVKLFSKLVDRSSQVAVLNLDDLGHAHISHAANRVDVVTYAIDNTNADVVLESTTSSIWENEVIMRTPLGRLQVITKLLGKANAYNMLAAVATGIALRIPLESIGKGIEEMGYIPGRSQVIDDGESSFSVIVDAADTPEAIHSLLSTFAGGEIANRVFAVVGARGNDDLSFRRPVLGEVLYRGADMVILTNDDPRWQEPNVIVEEINAGLPDFVQTDLSGYAYPPLQDKIRVPLWFEPHLLDAQESHSWHIMEDRWNAIRAAIGTAVENDVVIIFGRGHKDFMEFAGEDGFLMRSWFDDRKEAAHAMTLRRTFLDDELKLDRTTIPWGNALEEAEEEMGL